MEVKVASEVGRNPASGFSLVEVMVAMVLFIVGLLSLLAVFTSTLASSFDNRARLTAASLAASDIDQARALDYYALVDASATKVVDGRSYQVAREVTVLMSSGSDTSSCVGSGSARQVYKKVSTSVSTSFRSSTRPIRSDTVVRAPVFDPTTARGAIGFRVLARNATPMSGVQVSTGGPTVSTDPDGCVFFDALVPGSYTITVTPSPGGYVTESGSSSLTQTVTVPAGQVVASTMVIARPATVRVTTNVYNGLLVTPGHTLPTGVSARLATPDRLATTRTETAAQALSAGTAVTWTVYPSTGGYDAYLSPCTPVVHPVTEPATTVDAVLALSPVTVTLTTSSNGNNSANRIRNKTITAQWVPTSGTCSEPVTTFATSTSSTCGTCSVQLALPAGRWRLTIAGTSDFAFVDVQSRTPAAASIVAS